MSSTIDPHQLARDIISRFERRSDLPCTGFRYLMEAKSGLEAFSSARIDLAAYDYGRGMPQLVDRLKHVFESVYGKVPEVIVYTPHKPGDGKVASDSTN